MVLSLLSARPARLPLVTSSLLLALSLGCASGLPAVVSATPDEVSVEFENKKKLSTTKELAEKQCSGYGKIAQFEVVSPSSSDDSSVAKYRCVPPQGQVAADARARAEEQAGAARAAAEAIAAAQAAQAAQTAADAAAQTPPVAAETATDAAAGEAQSELP